MTLNVGTKEIHISWKICCIFLWNKESLNYQLDQLCWPINPIGVAHLIFLIDNLKQFLIFESVIREIFNLPIGLQYLPNNKCHVLIFIFFDHIHMVVKVKRIKIPYHHWKAWRCQLSRSINLIYGKVYVNVIELDSNWSVRNLWLSLSWNCH